MHILNESGEVYSHFRFTGPQLGRRYIKHSSNVSTLKKHSTSLVSEKVAAELIVFKNKCKLRHKIADSFPSSG